MKRKIICMVFMFIAVFSAIKINASAARSTYNDVFASTKGSGYSLSQGKSSASSSFTKGTFVYVWGYVHDSNNNLYKSYSSGMCNMTLSIYRPNGTCACTYTYNNSDNNWIGCKLDTAGTWKIQSKITGSIYGTNTRTITVKNSTRSTYNNVFASTKGSGYSLSQAKSSASSSFTKGNFVYVWGYVHDSNNNLYKSYSSGTCNMTLSIYRPNGTCAYSYTYKNSDNNWIRCKLDTAGTWKIQSKITGSISGTNTQTIAVKDTGSIDISGDIFYYNPTVGDVYYLKAKAYPSNTSKFIWSTSNSNIVSISSSGKMVAKAVGTATITAKTSDGRSKSVLITVRAANKWKTGKFDTGYTAPNYTTVKLNKNTGNGKIRIYTYDMMGWKTSGQMHVTLRDWNGNWIREFDVKSGDTLNLGNNYGEYRIYIAKKKYPNTVIGGAQDFENGGKCCNWGINCTSNCYIG